MATIRAYTTIEQSRKLAEILPLESADNVIVSFGDRYGVKTVTMPKEILDVIRTPFADIRETTMCWSLAALLAILPFPVLYMEMLGGMILWSCECHFMETNEVVKMEHYNNPIDACYEMIIRLNELNLL